MDLNVTKVRKKVTILGSTGSIGQNTIDIVERSPDLFEVVALTAFRNVSLLAKQAKKLNAKLAVIGDDKKYLDLKKQLSGSNIEIAAGPEALIDAATRNTDWTMASIVGVAGLLPTLASIKSGNIIGLANKECLVSAGDIFNKELSQNAAKVIPVDSEHNAIFQAFDFSQAQKIRRIILTASGGPFYKHSKSEMINITREQAIEVSRGNINISDFNEDLFSSRIYTSDIPDPDLLIRTSGEKRISNFLLWQAAYAELVFIDTLWPDFSFTDFEFSISEYQRRERRYGG